MSTWRFDLLAADVQAPGLDSLDTLRRVVRGEQMIDTLAPAALPPPLRLAVSERRRTSQAVRLVMACVEQILAQPPVPLDSLRCIFAADEGTGETCQQMLEAVTTTKLVSPTVFTNSVQNVSSGYVTIGHQIRGSVIVLSQGLESFACGLLCCLTEMDESSLPVLLVTCDAAMPAPLSELRPVPEACASAWLVAPAGGMPGALGRFEVDLRPRAGRTTGSLPGWWPERWASLATAPSVAALGLLECGTDATIDLTLNGVLLSLRRVDRNAA